MSTDPRAALAALTTALEQHLELASVRRGEDDPAVVAAYDRIADAFDRYDTALMEAYGEVTPLQVFDEDDDDEDDDAEDEDLDDDDLDEDDEDDDDEELDEVDEDAVDADESYEGLDPEDYDDENRD